VSIRSGNSSVNLGYAERLWSKENDPTLTWRKDLQTDVEGNAVKDTVLLKLNYLVNKANLVHTFFLVCLFLFLHVSVEYVPTIRETAVCMRHLVLVILYR